MKLSMICERCLAPMTNELFPELGPGGTLETPGGRGTWKTKAYPMPPGTGPENETCGTCTNCRVLTIRSGKRFRKCALMTPSHGAATDIKKSSPACGRFEAAAGLEAERIPW